MAKLKPFRKSSLYTFGKQRSWDKNIGRLIVFSMTIIIAVGFLGLLAFFYNESREDAAEVSVLAGQTSTYQEIRDIGALSDDVDDAKIEFNPINDMYALWWTGDSSFDDMEDNHNLDDFDQIEVHDDGDCDSFDQPDFADADDCIVYSINN